jgi:hypothetical protein
MTLCPVVLERCDRPECAGGRCEESAELMLAPCAGCGYLVVMRGAGICVDCLVIELKQTTEA